MTLPDEAAYAIVDALGKRNHQDATQLRAMLARRDIPARYLAGGVRVIRDVLGANALVVVREGRRSLYVLDPDVDEGTEWSLSMARRGLAEGKHLEHVLDWLAKAYGNRGVIRSARRHARNLREELEDVVASLDGAQA